MDHAVLRRGGTTIHKIYENYSHQNQLHDDKHFGNTMAILCGDLANQFALEIIADSEFAAVDKERLMRAVSREISEVIFGQINDILLTYQQEFTEEDVLKVHQYKTAPYTFRLPLHSGAILAGADEGQLEIIEKYAMPCGIAFQIRDDILGVFGDDADTGKESISDIVEGKKTILVTEAYKHANDSQIKVLEECLGNTDLTDEQASRFRQVIRDTGSLEYSQKRGKEYVEIAKQELSQLTNVESGSLEFLMELADYMVSRQQ
jgi:geranylgeranyl diphosphate synthase type I